MSAINVYLKYFHSGSKTIEEMLQQVEIENKKKEEGIITSDHIDKLHLDEKENGGVETDVIIGFTSKSYRAAKKSKSKGKLFEKTVKIHQDKYSNTGNAWKVWDSSIVCARWCYANRHLFEGKSLHELGSGCGLVGILASFYCKDIVLSDYKDEILVNIQRNIDINTVDSSSQSNKSIHVRNLDFEKVYSASNNNNQSATTTTTTPMIIKEDEKVDYILGCDILYGVHLSEWLPPVIDQLLKSDGVCFLANPKSRVGAEEFLENMSNRKFHCKVWTIPEKFCEDFAKKSCWDMIACSRNSDVLNNLPIDDIPKSLSSSGNTKKLNAGVEQDGDDDDDMFDFGDSFFHHKALKQDFQLKETFPCKPRSQIE